MSADTRPRLIDNLGRTRRSFWDWRGRRPFWGGMLCILAGIPITYIPYQTMTLGDLHLRMATTAGAGSLIIGVLLIVLGLTMWFQPQSRVFAGVAAILLALVSLVVSNFGAFLIGFLLALIGGGLGVSWMPGRPPAEVSAEVPAQAPAEVSAETPAHAPADSGGDDAGTPTGPSLVKGNDGRHRGD